MLEAKIVFAPRRQAQFIPNERVSMAEDVTFHLSGLADARALENAVQWPTRMYPTQTFTGQRQVPVFAPSDNPLTAYQLQMRKKQALAAALERAKRLESMLLLTAQQRARALQLHRGMAERPMGVR